MNDIKDELLPAGLDGSEGGVSMDVILVVVQGSGRPIIRVRPKDQSAYQKVANPDRE